MKKHLPNFLTCCNLMTGGLGIYWVSMEDQPENTLWFICIAAFFDVLDGLSARILNVTSEIGKQLDSLADLVSFGVLPSLGLIAWHQSLLFCFPSLEFRLLPLLIIPFSALRLAKFNIANNQESEFRGLPTPANALMIGTFLLDEHTFYIRDSTFWILLTLLSCFLLVSNIRMIAFKFKSWRWKGNQLRYSLLLLIALGFTLFQFQFLSFVIPTYILFSVVGNYLIKPVEC